LSNHRRRKELGRATDGDEVRAIRDYHDGDDTMSRFQKILVPTDFSPHAQEAFRVADDLASATGATVVVFHVFKPPAVVSDGDRLLSAGDRGETKDVWEELRKIQAKDSAVRIEHEAIVADRPDAEHILRILEERGCDLIVMGTHGRTGLKHLLFGSVTEDVVRTAHCPVMVVKLPARKAVASTQQTAGQPATRVKS
jgi:nucleotide-binding universal stress UspA family protein